MSALERAGLVILFVVVLGLALLTPGATRAGTAQQDIGLLNAQRAANGIPAGIVERADWSDACAAHIAYMKRNNYVGHPEDSSKPGYSDEGDWAGTHSVLHRGGSWMGPNPWEWAPIHLSQLLAPALEEMGVADEDGYICATTWPGYTRTTPDDNTVVTYPGNGTAAVYASEVAAESPFVPGQFVGIPQGTRTGPYLYAYVWGPWAEDWEAVTLVSASLRGPQGEVEVRHVDRSTDELGPYLPPGSGIVIPVKSLQPATTYQATVVFQDEGSELPYSWSFTTAARANALALFFTTLASHRVRVVITSNAPNPRLTIRQRGATASVPLSPGQARTWLSRPLTLRVGALACVRSGGGDSGYAELNRCARRTR